MANDLYNKYVPVLVFYAKKCIFERIFHAMIDSIIIEYLKHNRRLVIPKLGAFLVKEPDGSVVFSELLRGDDGVLRGLIKARGVGDIEAAGVIDRFVFEVRHALDSGRVYKIGDFGVLRRGENGIISFRSARPEPVRQRSASPAVQPSATADAVEAAKPVGDDTVKPQRRRSKGTDMFVVVAIVIALIAVAVMVYGYVRANRQDGTTLKEMFIPDNANAGEQTDEAVAAEADSESASAEAK